jgi:hypothetical protein
MNGITRIQITDQVIGRGSYRFDDSRKRQPMADNLYRYIAGIRRLPLLPGEGVIQCTKEEAAAIYDWELGIDVILAFDNGMQITMQEKFLFTNWQTVTIEYMNNPQTGEKGDWFTLRANWYFVGYDTNKTMRWDDWILLDWPATKFLTAQNNINWHDQNNKHDGARASFKYAYMNDFPRECVVASSSWPEFKTYPRTASDNAQMPLFTGATNGL